MEINEVRIIRLGKSDITHTYCCMDSATSPWRKATTDCQEWFRREIGKSIDGYHVLKIPDIVIGQLYFALSENSFIPDKLEPNVAVIYCEWILQEYQGKGLGNLLFKKFRDELTSQGVKGIITEIYKDQGKDLKKRYLNWGYEVIHESNHQTFLYYPITQPTLQINEMDTNIPVKYGKEVEIRITRGFMCPYDVSTLLLLRKVSQEFGGLINFRDESESAGSGEQFGIARKFLINGKMLLHGGESEESIRKIISDEIDNAKN